MLRVAFKVDWALDFYFSYGERSRYRTGAVEVPKLLNTCRFETLTVFLLLTLDLKQIIVKLNQHVMKPFTTVSILKKLFSFWVPTNIHRSMILKKIFFSKTEEELLQFKLMKLYFYKIRMETRVRVHGPVEIFHCHL